MLDAVGREDLDLTRVEMDRDGDDDRVLGIAEPLGDAGLDRRVRERLLELREIAVRQSDASHSSGAVSTAMSAAFAIATRRSVPGCLARQCQSTAAAAPA